MSGRWGDPINRFVLNLDVTPVGCWEWTATRRPTGYGAFVGTYAHRWSYEHFVGKIPDGLWIDHLCRNRACVNPDHLEAVTPGENSRRGLTGAHYGDRTHCDYGHEFTLDNIIERPEGGRRCRTCVRESARERRAACRV